MSGVFISDYLGLLSDTKDIQPTNRITTHAHTLDELAHSGIFRSFARGIYQGMNEKQRRVFAQDMAKPIRWFASRELELWRRILEHIDSPHEDEIIGDCYAEGTSDLTSAKCSFDVARPVAAGRLVSRR